MIFGQTQATTLTPQVQQAQTTMDKAQAAYQCEIDGSGLGCEGASNLQGDGPMAHLKESEFQQAQATYQSLDTRLKAAQQTLGSAQRPPTGPQGRPWRSSRQRLTPSFRARKGSTTSSRPR